MGWLQVSDSARWGMGRRLFPLNGLFLTLLVALIFALPRESLAVRPFVTDDARVLDEHTMQLETSVRYDQNTFANLNLLAMSPKQNLEFTAGFSDGFPLDKESNRSFSIIGPLMQVKYLIWPVKPNSYPGLAIAAGALPPWGRGDFRPDRWSQFVFLAATQSLFDNDRVLIHANLGISTTNPASVATWGLGAQFLLIGGLNGVAEIFYNDVYAGKTGGAYQMGFRHIVNDDLQIDLTLGSGLFGSEQIPTFVGMGLRIVSDRLW